MRRVDPLPPGCLSIDCAHGRSIEYYAETVYPGNENGFMAVKCTSMRALNAGHCRGRPQPMGYATPSTVKGSYFLKTNAESPYGLNSVDPQKVVCNTDDGASK